MSVWIGGTGDWNISANWSGGVPGSLAPAVFNSAGDTILTNVEVEDVAGLAMSSALAYLDVQGELTVADTHLNGVSNSIDSSLGSLTVQGGGLIAGGYVTSATGIVHLTDGGSYQWNGDQYVSGAGSTQTIDLGKSSNDTFQFSTAFGGEITNFYSGDIISYSGAVNSVDIGNNSVTFHAANGQSYTINFLGRTYNASNLIVVGNIVETSSTPELVRDDFTGHGKSDILIQNTNGTLDVAEIGGNGKEVYTSIGDLGPQWSFRGNGDFFGDGETGFLIQNASGSLNVGEVSGNVVAYSHIGALGSQWAFEGTGDFLGEGHDQLLLESTAGAIDIGDAASGVVQYSGVGALGSQWTIRETRDFLGDGKAQFLIQNTSGALNLGEITGNGITYTNIGSLGSQWTFEGAGDFLDEGHDQFLIQNSSGQIDLGDVKNGLTQFTSVGALGAQWKFVGAGDYDSSGLAGFMIESTSGVVDLGVIHAGNATYANVGSLGSQWTFHT